MHVPYSRAKHSYVLPVVTILAITAPFGVLALSDSPEVQPADQSNLAAIPAKLAEVALASAPDVVLPLRQLTGLNLPDLRLSDLRKLPLPRSIPVPAGLPVPSGVRLPSEIPLPNLGGVSKPSGSPGFIAEPGPEAPAETPAAAQLEGDPNTPALAPGAVPGDLIDQVGAQVKELTRDTPFSMVALTADNLAGTSSKIRAQRADGTWSPWYSTDEADGRQRVAAKRTGTEPIYVGSTKAVQVLTTRKPVSEPAPLTDHSGDPAQINWEKLAAVLIDPGRGAIDENLTQVAAALPGGGPKVITRAQWGADESLRCEEPTYDDAVNAITVHHTAGRNDYSKAESAGIVRAIYSYHAKTLGWCDIGYNALVDKYGQIFEGRYGGLDRAVEGAHAGGFNINTAGVAFMGNHEEEPPTDIAVQAMGDFIGWRAKVAGIQPEGSTTMYSEGSDYTKYALGQAVKLPNIFAHRDVGNTSCPGDAAYELMDKIRAIAEKTAGTVQGGSRAPSRPKPEQQAGNQHTAPQTQNDTEADLATLADLTGKLLDMVGRNPVAGYWNQQGAANGPLGQAKSEPIATEDGGQYAEFVNGYVYSTPDGRVFAVVGKILERFRQLGAGTGMLGLPASNEYQVQDGVRADFQRGSLIFNRLTGIVTTVLKNFGSNPVTVPGGSPIPGTLQNAPAAGSEIPAPLPEAAPPAPADPAPVEPEPLPAQ
ncbi:N-acetylmuramoyl-L-alanine amidase [Nocardia yamanashiensis]|uniref:N-acetylmuramoyl-L-alanine amidase n=1 Tax=Nocardia yamanashiensis TaxID=209247 RepID=UPI0009FEB376|nr:N-acetylmuramoyl-L-alanine amidase [Nocardia yamanashiensis]